MIPNKRETEERGGLEIYLHRHSPIEYILTILCRTHSESHTIGTLLSLINTSKGSSKTPNYASFLIALEIAMDSLGSSSTSNDRAFIEEKT